MTTYQTRELIASHHAELDRLAIELLELGSRVSSDEPDVKSLRERVRALGARLRAHRAEESAALLADAGRGRDRLAARMMRRAGPDAVAEIEKAIARADDGTPPLELVRAALQAARTCRANLDALARD
ncbi:MAG: hypothetical protein VYE22_00685 [Myxococcota bacterium]|nr:hypothetical protein [Myxococcota bacterium]